MECQGRRPSYRQANQLTNSTEDEDLLFHLPKDGFKKEIPECNQQFVASDGCDLLEMDLADEIVKQFLVYQQLLIWLGLRFGPTDRRPLVYLKFFLLYFLLGIGMYTAIYDIYHMITDFNPTTAPGTLVFVSLILQALLMLLFLAFWQRKLLFESFFHIYRHSKIDDVKVYDKEQARSIKTLTRLFRGLQAYCLLYTVAFIWMTWWDKWNGFMHQSYRFAYYFEELRYIRSFTSAYYFSGVIVVIHYYCCLTNALHIEVKKFNWKIAQLDGTITELKEKIEELIKCHTKLSRAIRSMDRIFKIFAFVMTASVIPSTIFVFAFIASRANIGDILASLPSVFFCVLEYYGIMYPAKIHAELGKSKALFCMNYNVWTPYEESLNKVAHTLVMHLDQTDLGISLWGFTVISKPLILTTVSAMMTCLAFFLDLRPKSENSGLHCCPITNCSCSFNCQ